MRRYVHQVDFAEGDAGLTAWFVLSVCLLVVGAGLALAESSVTPLLLSVGGVVIYVMLLRRGGTKVEQLTALEIGAEGIAYLIEPKPGASKRRLAWSEIMDVRAVHDEMTGLVIVTSRYGPRGFEILVPIWPGESCIEAAEVARSYLEGGNRSAI